MNRFAKFLSVFTLIILMSLASAATANASTIRVGLTRNFGNRASVSIANPTITVGRGHADGSFTAARDLTSSSGFVISAQGGQIIVSAGGASVFTFTTGTAGNPQIRIPGGAAVQISGYTYRGALEFIASGNTFLVVNVVNLEDYLLGVVPVEMSPSFHPEALKAQAIASRTFAMYNVNGGRHNAQNFDLCNHYHCQVYLGTAREHENTNRAVRDTAGVMIRHGGQPILASFFASCGGITDNSENVWVATLPYLRATREVAPEHEPVIWTRTFTWAQLTQAARSAGANIGNVTGLTISQSNGGRVQELTFVGTNGQWTRTGEGIRTMFGSVGGQLRSRNFHMGAGVPAAAGGGSASVSITDGTATNHGALSGFQVLTPQGTIITLNEAYVFDGLSTQRIAGTGGAVAASPVETRTGGTGVTFYGRGWGHGVGMSQRGAEGMARQGFTHLQILHHYYTGVEIR